MILAAIVIALQDPAPTAAKLVSTMIARYHDAKTIKGECTTTVTIGERVVTVNSSIQIERPLKIYLGQSVAGQGLYVLTSDGRQFSYQKPMSIPASDRSPNARLVEDVMSGMKLGEIYRAASESLAERSTVFDIIVSDLPDLQRMRDQWQSMGFAGQEDLNGEQVYKILGKWRLNKVSQVSGTFKLFLNAQGDLRKYEVEQLPGFNPLNPGETEVSITRSTVANFSVGAQVDPKLFTVLR